LYPSDNGSESHIQLDSANKKILAIPPKTLPGKDLGGIVGMFWSRLLDTNKYTNKKSGFSWVLLDDYGQRKTRKP